MFACRLPSAFHSLSTISLQAPCMRKKWKISREREREKNALLGGKFRSRSLSLLIYSAQGQHRPAAAALYLAPHRPFSATAAALFPYFPLSSPFNYLVCWLCHTTTGGPLCLFLFFFFVFRVKIYLFCFCSLCRESRRRRKIKTFGERRRRDFDPNSIMTSST